MNTITESLNVLSSNLFSPQSGILGSIITAFENVVNNVLNLF